MLYVDNEHFDPSDFERYFSLFDRHPILGKLANKSVAVRLSDPVFWLALCLYAQRSGGTVFPLPADTPLEAARRRAERSGCDALLFGESGEAALGQVEEIRASVEAQSSGSSSAAREPGLIQMSSGTTGEPKYIRRSWSNIAAEIKSYVRHFDEANEMTPIVACPINHSYGLICGVLVALERGVQPIVVRNLNPKSILRQLSEVERPLLYSSPTLIATLTMLTREESPLFAVMTSGTLMQKAWFEGVRKKVRHLYQQYGCSEAGCISLAREIQSPSEIGVPLPHLTVSAGSSADAPGEILVELPEGKTVATRDLGYLEAGELYFVSRLDDMINVSGLNVYPSEVEEIVLALPGVTDAVVYKRSHGFGQDQVCLQFVAGEELSHQRVRAWCAERLASHQVPMSIAQVETIPRLPNGKVSRRALAEGSVGAVPSGALHQGVAL